MTQMRARAALFVGVAVLTAGLAAVLAAEAAGDPMRTHGVRSWQRAWTGAGPGAGAGARAAGRHCPNGNRIACDMRGRRRRRDHVARPAPVEQGSDGMPELVTNRARLMGTFGTMPSSLVAVSAGTPVRASGQVIGRAADLARCRGSCRPGSARRPRVPRSWSRPPRRRACRPAALHPRKQKGPGSRPQGRRDVRDTGGGGRTAVHPPPTSGIPVLAVLRTKERPARPSAGPARVRSERERAGDDRRRAARARPGP